MQKGGLLRESRNINENKKWPCHFIAHESRPDHDFNNAQGFVVQIPLFILIDIGCTIFNLLISLQVRILNYTALMQISSSFLYSFLKIRQVFWRVKWHKSLLD